jgi:hypothetical protein
MENGCAKRSDDERQPTALDFRERTPQNWTAVELWFCSKHFWEHNLPKSESKYIQRHSKYRHLWSYAIIFSDDLGCGRVHPASEGGDERGSAQNGHYDHSALVSYEITRVVVMVLT